MLNAVPLVEVAVQVGAVNRLTGLHRASLAKDAILNIIRQVYAGCLAASLVCVGLGSYSVCLFTMWSFGSSYAYNIPYVLV